MLRGHKRRGREENRRGIQAGWFRNPTTRRDRETVSARSDGSHEDKRSPNIGGTARDKLFGFLVGAKTMKACRQKAQSPTQVVNELLKEAPLG